jgi:CheY-like chemotaxis protein
LLTQAGSLVVAELSGIPETQVRLRAHEPDLVVVDLMLPAVDGVEGVARLKALAPERRVTGDNPARMLLQYASRPR